MQNMRLLLFNLATDADDSILGFTTRWICALAERVDFIHVITMRSGRLEVPANVRVYSVGKEKGFSEPRRAVEFYRHLLRIVREEKIDVCFSHMIPIFSVLAAPVLRLNGIPIVTWYCHPGLSWTLKLAHHLSVRMVSGLSTSYRYRLDKLTVVGQGIDTELFKPADVGLAQEDVPVILCVGRLSPAKDHPTLFQAVWTLRQSSSQPFRVVIVGGPATPSDATYMRLVQEQVKDLGLGGTVYFERAVAMERLPYWYRGCAVHVNLAPIGSGDKVALEAMACGAPTIVANIGFAETLGQYAQKLLFEFGNSEQLAHRLQWVLSLSQSERTEIGRYLRQQVVSMHGLSRLAQSLVDIFEVLKPPKGQRRSAKARQERLMSSDA
jgi:glycosyltransferase involved in cell wall biosynthesis